MFKICRKKRDTAIIEHVSINNNYTHDVSDTNLELENKNLKRELSILKTELIKKHNYILDIDEYYKCKLSVIENDIFNQYEKLLNELDTENSRLLEELNKKTQELKDIKTKYLNLCNDIKKTKDNESKVDNYICVICLDNMKSILIEPCNHLCCCEDCYYILKKPECPICREKILHASKIYI